MPALRLALRPLAWFSGSSAPGRTDHRLRPVPDVLVGEIAEDRREQQEDHDREPRGVAASRASARPSTPGTRTRPSPSGRPSASVARSVVTCPSLVSGGGMAMLRFAKYGIVVQAVRRLRVGNSLSSSAGCCLLVAGQQRIDVSRAAVTRLGDQRQVGRKRIVVRSARRESRSHRGYGKLSDGSALRVAASPVSGFTAGTSVCHWLAIALISASL